MFGMSLLEWTGIYIYFAVFVIIILSISLYLQIRYKRILQWIPYQYFKTTRLYWLVNNFVLASVLSYYSFHKLIEKNGHYAAMTQEHEFHISPVVILEKLVAILLVISPLLWIFSLLLSFSVFILFQASRKAHAEYFFSKLTENPWQYIVPREGKDELHSDSAEEELVAKETHNIDNDSTGKY